MGSVQKLATVVIVGLVALSTIIFLYLGDENNRIEDKQQEQLNDSIARAEANYVSLCLQCHGPAGEGYMEPGAAGTGRIGAPLGGINTSLNQEGINSQGTPIAGGVEARGKYIHDTIYNGLQNPDGSVRMPTFGGASGSLTDEQINELVLMIQNVDWNDVYNLAVTESGGYPTPPPKASPAATEAPAGGEASSSGGEAAGAPSITIKAEDIYFDPSEITIPANTDVTINLPNEGATAHDFSIDSADIAVPMPVGETKSITVNLAPGDYEYYCNVPGHKEAGMIGTLHVVEGYTLPGSGGEEAAAPSSGEEGAAAPASGAEAEMPSVTIKSEDIFFDPSEMTIPANTDVKINLPNEGGSPHDFSIDAADISIAMEPGETDKSVVVNLAPGDYEYYCNVPGHKEAGMIGTLHVEEGYVLPGSESSSAETQPAESEAAAAPGAGEQAITITSEDIFFDPSEATIPANTDVTIHLPNEGSSPHDFSIDSEDISISLEPGETDKSVVVNLAPGDYEYYCNVPGHKEAGMVGTLHVEEGYVLPGSSTEASEASDASPAPEASPASEVAAGGEQAITITSEDIFFDPSEATIPANTDVTIHLPNEGSSPHDFSIDSEDISISLEPGETDKSVVVNLAPGDYEYYCNVPGHKEAGMVGTLHVEEGYVLPGTEEEAAAQIDEGSEGDVAASGDVVKGKQLASQCMACHTVDGTVLVGPSWQGLYGSTVTLEGGDTVTADDSYLTESIVDPTAKIVEGFPPAMPPYTTLSDQDIADLIAYIKSLE